MIEFLKIQKKAVALESTSKKKQVYPAAYSNACVSAVRGALLCGKWLTSAELMRKTEYSGSCISLATRKLIDDGLMQSKSIGRALSFKLTETQG